MTKTTNFPVVLKTIIAQAIAEKTLLEANADEKKLRAKLRIAKPVPHVKGTTWQAMNAKELDAIRCVIDPVYAARLAKAKTTKRTKAKAPAAAVAPAAAE